MLLGLLYKVLTFQKIQKYSPARGIGEGKSKKTLMRFLITRISQRYTINMDASQVPMAGYKTDDGKYIKGIEDYIPFSQYRTEKNIKRKLSEDIKEKWQDLSRNSKFHAIFCHKQYS